MQKTQKNSSREKSHKRAWVRMGILLLVVAFLGWGYEEKSTLYPLIRVSEKTVLEKYTAEYAPQAAQNRTLKEIAFTKSFRGSENETFYVVWQTEQGTEEIEKYRITADTEPPGYVFEYQTVFEDLPLPASQFTLFTETAGDWKQAE